MSRPAAMQSRYPSRFAVIEQLITNLFEADARRMQQWIDKIDSRNREVTGDNNLLGFNYMGRYYRPSHVEGADPYNVRPLDPSLWNELEAMLVDVKAIDNDKAFVKQALYTLLDPCQSLQDVRDALPDCLVSALPEIRDLERDKGELFTLEGNERGRRQFDRILPKIEAYAVARMIY